MVAVVEMEQPEDLNREESVRNLERALSSCLDTTRDTRESANPQETMTLNSSQVSSPSASYTVYVPSESRTTRQSKRSGMRLSIASDGNYRYSSPTGGRALLHENQSLSIDTTDPTRNSTSAQRASSARRQMESGALGQMRVSAPAASVSRGTDDKSIGNEAHAGRRAASLRHDASPDVRSYSSLFPERQVAVREREGWSLLGLGKKKLIRWTSGVSPRMIYAHDAHDSDGERAGLTATLLVRMGMRHRVWDVVGSHEKFVVRVVGSHVGVGYRGGNMVVYSVVDGGEARVHGRREGVGWSRISERRGAVVDKSDVGESFTVSVGVSCGGREAVGGEVRWRLGEAGEDRTRSAAALLRFGYYFFLTDCGGVRLFASTHTPEHVRLVARRTDGWIDGEFSDRLTYVVLQVAAD